jgi:FkbM family methyltransferase
MMKNSALHQPDSQTPARRPAGVLAQLTLSPLNFVKQSIQCVLNRMGYQILRFPAPHSYVRHILTLFAALGVNCVIDVGAHEGEFYQLLRRNGYDGRIVSFEPVPESFERLRRVAEGDPHWRGYNVALGCEAGSLPINVPDSTGFASFLQPNAYCVQRFPHAHWEGRTVVVRMEQLQSIYPDATAGITRPRAFLKMDTQGWDSHVLEGAGATLVDVVALQSEISVIPIYHGMRSMVESIAHYNALGFELTHLFPVTFDADGLRVIEYDCVLCRNTPRAEPPHLGSA